jgi:ribonuclease D
MIHVIETQSALDTSCGDAAKMPWVGLDTEFERIRTYYPKLCLVQMATSDMTVCIDPLASLDFSPLRSLLINPDVEKIVHAARQDLEVIHVALGINTAPLFDTQIAAQLCGYREQVAYAELVKDICEVDLPKQHTRTAWCRRPLSGAEVDYALDDARYLGPMYLNLKEHLGSLGRDSWVHEDCEELTAPAILKSGTSRAVKKIQSSTRGFSRTAQSVAFQLALWREKTAQSQDLPREWLLKSKTLLAVAEKLPTKSADLNKIRELSESDRKRWGSAILAAVQTGSINAREYQPMSKSLQLSAKEKKTERLLWEHLKVVCNAANIPTAAVVGRQEIRKLMSGEQDIRLLQGWRREFVGTNLRDMAVREGTSITC